MMMVKKKERLGKYFLSRGNPHFYPGKKQEISDSFNFHFFSSQDSFGIDETINAEKIFG